MEKGQEEEVVHFATVDQYMRHVTICKKDIVPGMKVFWDEGKVTCIECMVELGFDFNFVKTQ